MSTRVGVYDFIAPATLRKREKNWAETSAKRLAGFKEKTMFTIEWEGPDLIVLCLAGFWDHDKMSAFRDSVRANLRRVRANAPFDMLVDLTDYPPQATPIVEAQEKVIGEIQAHGLRRGATVMASALMRLQVERVNSWKHKHYFTSMAEARAWLAQPIQS